MARPVCKWWSDRGGGPAAMYSVSWSNCHHAFVPRGGLSGYHPEPWCSFSRLLQRKYLNNIVEQDHRRIKRLVRPGLGFGGLRTAKHTLAGYEAMAMIRKGQVHNVGGRDMQAQAAFIASLFKVAA